MKWGTYVQCTDRELPRELTFSYLCGMNHCFCGLRMFMTISTPDSNFRILKLISERHLLLHLMFENVANFMMQKKKKKKILWNMSHHSQHRAQQKVAEITEINIYGQEDNSGLPTLLNSSVLAERFSKLWWKWVQLNCTFCPIYKDLHLQLDPMRLHWEPSCQVLRDLQTCLYSQTGSFIKKDFSHTKVCTYFLISHFHGL